MSTEQLLKLTGAEELILSRIAGPLAMSSAFSPAWCVCEPVISDVRFPVARRVCGRVADFVADLAWAELTALAALPDEREPALTT